MKYDLIGVNIKMLREKAKMSQAELADSICTQAQISRIEKGEVIPLSTTLYEIANKLEIDINQFFNMACYQRFDYIEDVKQQLSDAMRFRDYQLVYEIVKSERKNVIFTPVEYQQVLMWYEGVAVYYVKGCFDHAMKLLLQALQLRKKTPKTLYSMTEIGIINSIGILHDEEEKFDVSVDSFKKALIELKKLQKNVDQMKIKIYYGLSKSLTSLSNYKDSMYYCKEGIRICLKQESVFLLGELYFQLAVNYYHARKNHRSLHYFEKSLKTFEIVDNFEYIEIVKCRIERYFPNGSHGIRYMEPVE